MNLIGLDISSTSIGWCLWDGTRALAHGSIPLKGDLGQRICLTETALKSLIKRQQPGAVAYEGAVFHRPQAIIAQQRVVGVALLVVRRARLLDMEIQPAQGKKALAESGKADKAAMIAAAADYLAPEYAISPERRNGTWYGVDLAGGLRYTEHTADALGIAMAAWPLIRVEEQAA